MAVITWSPETTYETGVSKGVFYPKTGAGVPWNGLVSVEESYDGGDVEPVYFDGARIGNLVGAKFFQATVTSISHPVGFGPCIGNVAVRKGFVITGQPKLPFDFCYRVEVGDSDYELHLVYNATAIRDGVERNSLADKIDVPPSIFKIQTVPPDATDYTPTAHISLGTRVISKANMATIENLLYGKTGTPAIPTQSYLATLLS